MPAQYRVLYALLANGDREAIWRYVRAEGMQSEMHPSGVEPAGLTSYLPGWGSDPVPPEAYALTAEQTALKVQVRGSHADGADLVLDVAAWFPNIDPADPVLEVKTDGDVADVEHVGEPAVFTSWMGSARPYPGSGWTVTLRGAARRVPKQVTVTLRDGDREGTATAKVP